VQPRHRRSKLERAALAGHRFFKLAKLQQGQAKQGVGLGVARILADGAPMLTDFGGCRSLGYRGSGRIHGFAAKNCREKIVPSYRTIKKADTGVYVGRRCLQGLSLHTPRWKRTGL
jgi:hypothetical protein